jgi:LysM repeat protein
MISFFFKKTMLSLLAVGLLSAFSVAAKTGDDTHYLTSKDTIFITINDIQEKIFEHRLVGKQTLFSLAKFYGISIAELNYYNPEYVKKAPVAGQSIKIPVPNRAILRDRPAKFNTKDFALVCYVVKKSESVYKIAKGYFNMHEDSLIARNKLKNNDLKLGQKLLIGWLSVKGISESMRKVKDGPAVVKALIDNKTHFQVESVTKKEIQHRGVASWQKEDKQLNNQLFALHRDCPLNTMIAINNPMKNKTIYAKVIGRIPDNTESNVEVIVSPAVAHLLGALDPHFFVKVKYYK